MDVANFRGEFAVGRQGASRRSGEAVEDPGLLHDAMPASPPSACSAQGVHRIDRAAAADIGRDLHRLAVDLLDER
jgi:hypothetical protein